MVQEQHKYNLEQTFYSRLNSVRKEEVVHIKAAEKMRKLTWKKLLKQKVSK